ncbi:MAG: Putative iron-sulfur cluster assembly scaffold protein for SUF system, SufE2 [Ktedonobacterales bacterium]|jgi:nitrogen fixation NifU-like protein|nr:MAG: Putative iron-sulfur cluster assembly scaffold protein for SUF system, SufE2 [Ktedonobacterales bacterium]
MDDIYRQYILDHYREPHNHGTLEHPDVHAADTNPLCGDRIAIDLNVTDGRVTDVRFNGRGCAISQASASMLTEKIEGATLDELRALRPSDVLEMLGVEIGPARQRCALLSLRVLHQGIDGPYTGHLDDNLDDDEEQEDAAQARADQARTGL